VCSSDLVASSNEIPPALNLRDSDLAESQPHPDEPESDLNPSENKSQTDATEDVPMVQCPKCGLEIPATMECPMCSLAEMETTRCPKCHNEMPVLGECSICRDNDARTKQFAAQREAAQKEKEAREARKTKRLKSLLENQAPTWENAIKNYRTAQIPLSKWQIAGVCVVIVALFSGLSYWLTLYVQQNQAPANPSAEAIQLVSQSKAKDASTIDQYLTVQMEGLAAKGSLDQIDGWWCEGAATSRMKVKFMYRTKGGKEQVAEWTVDLDSKAIRPENELARKISP
jgi:ssDNA-binding Zn-finger/Zn-ribbon topoisomerase 1